MQYLSAFFLSLAIWALGAALPGDLGAKEAGEILTTSAEVQASTESQAHQVEQIRQMVLSLGPKRSTPAQLIQLARGLQPTAASTLFFRIADDYLHAGQYDLAADVLLQLLEQFPDEPVATDATLRLVRLYSSSEVAHTQRKIQDSARQLRLPAGWQKQRTNAAEELSTSSAQRDKGMLTYALFLANNQLQRHPELAKHSPFAFQCAVTARLSGRFQESKSWSTLLKHKRESAQWRSRALVESWLADSHNRAAPLAVTRCQPTGAPPHLDGILNDAVWQTADSFAPRSALDDLKSDILLAYDAEHCYIAIRCERIEGAQYSSNNQSRTYDTELAGHDRVELLLDTDRDYVTCFRLVVDHRGFTNDSCWHNASWNPRWFVAAGGRTRSWVVEAALPWSELTVSPPRAGAVWALSARRIVPTERTSSASDNFRLLIFD